jgi:hypothetical protein
MLKLQTGQERYDDSLCISWLVARCASASLVNAGGRPKRTPRARARFLPSPVRALAISLRAALLLRRIDPDDCVSVGESVGTGFLERAKYWSEGRICHLRPGPLILLASFQQPLSLVYAPGVRKRRKLTSERSADCRERCCALSRTPRSAHESCFSLW